MTTPSHQQIAIDILKIIGPAQNIQHLSCCMTRLRLTLSNLAPNQIEQLKMVPGVLGVVERDEEVQIVIGPGRVNQVKESLIFMLHKTDAIPKIGNGQELHDKIRRKNTTPFKILLKKISSVFLPLIPAFIACGLVTGILNITLKIDPSLSSHTVVELLKIVGNAAFWGINLFVGINAAKEFGGSPMLGGTMAAIISHPGLLGITLWGHGLVPGRGGVIAVLLVVAFSSWLERQIRKRMPPLLDLFLTPLIVILIATFTAILILQPFGGFLADAIGFAAVSSIEQGGAVTGFLLGGLFLPLVMTGLHQGLTPIHAQLLASTGVTILLPVLAMAGAGQVGAALAVYLKTRNRKLRKIIASALPVGMMGIGEPLIYGVTLPLIRPFAGACIGGACGGAVQAVGQVGATSLGLSGLPLSVSTDHFLFYLLGLLTAYAAGFIAAYILGFNDPAEEATEI